MTQEEDFYWLQLAVEDFTRRVWQRELSKFALDHEIGMPEETFIYSDYYIVINRTTEERISVSLIQQLPSEPVMVSLFYFIDYPQIPPEILHWNISESVEMLDDITELWTENLFVRKY
ncbi:MAG: hypothetical protein UW35_C0018G0002 [Candidatus Collierbacteria bacterium GW2011_GWF2_44_15]|uniref:Uncharacterized protein n=5 Tax=Candidatus Collieribacteriota TaxID=1752725 RepID=A0A0G1KEH3_9BACT|nr:MAG: hypothetical protein UW23_C0030G0003 [Candidatus Collierbacteria bacterium GW2011_GWA1_44_12]KKT39319.1 MAG: hypothetical protein UW26_C0004G0006 [Candidatus Collierbacteria bacterium GW2011_GWF1_44_12]KKT46239.1 MAG: hypothetical protein UW35_C0018G0002 [Candidatus Collierbacteria bacterium GW2011_GWF2_44_15]KKT98907.1 MAG: hypothetical protein UW99_C0014G0007 [Candidatus Collierbacteria bacterium GW2011_GWC2_45_15]KKU29897.1 MAG: hypothetical protein UX41_C0010G0008 [Candidatus Collie